MFTTLVKKEIHQNLLNLRFVVVCFATAALMVGSASVNVSSWLTRSREYSLNRDLIEQSIRDNDRWWTVTERTDALRKPPLLAIFAAGGERDPETQGLICNRILPRLRVELKRSVIGNVYLPTDLTFIVGVVLSLLVILLSFDCVSGEREKGTLKLILASPVPRDTVILAKWAGGLISLLLPMAMSMVGVLALLALVPDLGVDNAMWLRITAMCALFTVYVAVVFSMALMISVLLHSSGTSALCLLLVWLVMALLIPGTAGQIAHVLVRPAGMQGQYVRSLSHIPLEFVRVGERRIRDSLEYRVIVGVSWNEEHSEKHKELSDKFQRAYEIGGQTRALDKIVEDAHTMLRDEQEVERVSRYVLKLSPFGCLQDACEALAGTGFAREAALRHSYETYMRSVWNVVAEYRENPRILPAQLPSYVPPVERSAAMFTDALFAAGILCLMGLLFFLVAYRAFLRMNIC